MATTTLSKKNYLQGVNGEATTIPANGYADINVPFTKPSGLGNVVPITRNVNVSGTGTSNLYFIGWYLVTNSSTSYELHAKFKNTGSSAVTATVNGYIYWI